MLTRYFLAVVASAATALAIPFSFASPSADSGSRAGSTSQPPPPVIDLGYARVQGYYNATADQFW